MHAIKVIENTTGCNGHEGGDSAVIAEALHGGGEVMAKVIYAFRVEVCYTHTTPDHWITTCDCAPAKGDLPTGSQP